MGAVRSGDARCYLQSGVNRRICNVFCKLISDGYPTSGERARYATFKTKENRFLFQRPMLILILAHSSSNPLDQW